MRDDLKIWTTVGSAGTLSAADLAKVSFDKAVISLGQSIAPPPPASGAEEPQIGLPTTSVIVRYNVTPAAGLFSASQPFRYVLQLTYKGRVGARLGQFNVLTGADTDVVNFDSATFTPAHTFMTSRESAGDDSTVLDFVNCAYYVEATLTASAVSIGNPAAIGAVKVFASPDISR